MRRCGCDIKKMSEVDKSLLNLLNGLVRRQYFGEDKFSNEALKEQIFSDMADDEFETMLKRFQIIINSLVSADMDFAQLDAFLTSQMKKRQGAMTDTEAATVKKFWKLQKSKVHERVIADCVWESRLKSLNWRVDIQSKARHIDQLNQPSAIVELQLGPATSDKATEIVRFEMNIEKLTELLKQVEDIQKAIESHL